MRLHQLLAALGLLAPCASAQVGADAGPDQVVAHPSPAVLAGAIPQRSPLEWWTADGNSATEDKLLKWREGSGLTALGPIVSGSGGVLGWPADFVDVGGVIYGSDVGQRRLYTLDPNSAVATLIGGAAWSSTWSSVQSLAYDATGDRLFAVDTGRKQLLRINRSTGGVTAVGNGTLSGYPQVKSLAYHAPSDRLFAVDNASDWLLSIHPTTGAVTPVVVVQPDPTAQIEDLMFFGGELYGSNGLLSMGILTAAQLVRIDRTTGVVTPLGSIVPECSAHACLVRSLPEEFAWSQDSGPGTASFADPYDLGTSVSFSLPGEYVLRLTVFSQQGPVSDTLVVTSDACPNDPLKLAPGVCGCGVPDIDSDNDGTLDCIDGCPNDPLKTDPGVCGCGAPDVDSDGDGWLDCDESCPNDPLKLEPGVCGCGIPDTDGDGDGVADCIDECPSDPLKFLVGVCGCGVADTDSDGDGTADCIDGCPNDPLKVAQGQCGCGAVDLDSDGDGTADCIDGCPSDPLKTALGQCGCGVADTDSDGDGVADCNDLCPNDPAKFAPGGCGCGVPDLDTDADGVLDCSDNCPSVANPAQLNSDGDLFGDDCDNCPLLANPFQEDCDNDGAGDACELLSGTALDLNGNGVPDDCEPSTGASFCEGDGSAAACPCNNFGAPGEGCANSTGAGARLVNQGGISCSADDALLAVTQLPVNKAGILYMGTLQKNNGTGTATGDGLRCVAGQLKRFPLSQSGPGGAFTVAHPAAASGGLIAPGTTWYFQVWYRDTPQPCGDQQNFSNGLAITFAP